MAVMQRVLSLLVLQVAAYHGWRKFGTSGSTLSNQSRSNARWTKPSADFFISYHIIILNLHTTLENMQTTYISNKSKCV